MKVKLEDSTVEIIKACKNTKDISFYENVKSTINKITGTPLEYVEEYNVLYWLDKVIEECKIVGLDAGYKLTDLNSFIDSINRIESISYSTTYLLCRFAILTIRQMTISNIINYNLNVE